MIAGVKLNADGEIEGGARTPRLKAAVARSKVAAAVQPALLEAAPTAKLVGGGAADEAAHAGRRGRPRVIGDMKKYKAEKARERRARQKGVSGAKGEGST